MGELRDAALFRQQILDESTRIEKDKLDAQKKLEESEQAKYDNLRYRRRKIQEAYCDYRSFVKNTCLEYAIVGLMESALEQSDLSDRDMNMVFGFVKGFVKEQSGATNILTKAAGRTFVIDSIKEAVEEETEEIIAKADPKNPDTFVIDKEDIEKMMNKLDNNDDYNEVKSAIAVRVIGAEDVFLTNSKAEKEKIDDIVAAAQDKCASIEADPEMEEETKEAIKQEVTRECNRKLTLISEAPKSAVFDEMVRHLTRSSIKKNRKHFIIEESGKVDMDRVVNTVKIMYSLMEALSTSKLVNVDEKFIDETINNL